MVKVFLESNSGKINRKATINRSLGYSRFFGLYLLFGIESKIIVIVYGSRLRFHLQSLKYA